MAEKTLADFDLERDIAYRMANDRLPRVLGTLRPHLAAVSVKCGPIDAVAIDTYIKQWKDQPRHQWGGHPPDWEQEHKQYRKHMRRFEVAVWSGDTLCGLGL